MNDLILIDLANGWDWADLIYLINLIDLGNVVDLVYLVDLINLMLINVTDLTYIIILP